MSSKSTKSSTIPTIIIGRVPGYNTNISGNGIDYTKRLKNNLTNIVMRPTGYKINYEQFFDIGANIFKAYNGKQQTANTIYKFGPTTSLSVVPTSGAGITAINLWKNLVKTSFSKIGEYSSDSVKTQLNILATNDSTMVEVMSNRFDVSTAEQLATTLNGLGGKVYQNIKKVATRGTQMLSSAGGLQLLSNSEGNRNQFLSLLGGKALGIQSTIPKEWVSSDHNNTLQLMIKLVSPSGDSEMIDHCIIKPLMYLMLAASPVSYDGITFGYPTLWDVQADGMMDIKLGAITAMTITRGGNETQFNHNNEPLNIDIRLTIEPLAHGFASLTSSDGSSVVEMDKMLVNTPKSIIDSFKKTSNYTSIKL